MHTIDYLIFVVYMIAMLGVGLYFYKKNYFVITNYIFFDFFNYIIGKT